MIDATLRYRSAPGAQERCIEFPRLIQGGMGAAVSGWRLASAVARRGQLGVVSGTALGVVLARGLQDGDEGGHLRRALAAMPDQQIAGRVLDHYLLPVGRPANAGYRSVPVPRQRPSRRFQELTVAGGFTEVYLAREGHEGTVGINLLEKIQIATLPTLYGAMLAGVDWVLMGAGIPFHIPAALTALAEHKASELPLSVLGARPEDSYAVAFDPRAIVDGPEHPLRRPRFLAIVGSHVLAHQLAREQRSRPDGFVIERPIAGGHNAPPRGPMRLDQGGEPIYGERDQVDFERMRKLGLPFWVAGGYAHPERLKDALAEGACGVQVGTAFALCEESGFDPALRQTARELAAAGQVAVRTDPVASPTGYPFKVAQIPGTVADSQVYAARQRRCDISYLTSPYRREDGRLGYRCAAEPVADYLAKGGDVADTEGRICLCNGLIAAAGRPQRSADGSSEPALMTLGDDANALIGQLSASGLPYHAEDVIAYVLGQNARLEGLNDSDDSAVDGVLAGLFPGQGSQTRGMGEFVCHVAPELHRDCIELVGEDPFARVTESTRFAQPAIYCASIAGWMQCAGQLRPALLAGHSLGEISALVAAGAVDVMTGLKLAVQRGELMAQAELGGAEGMIAVLGGSDEQNESLAVEHDLAFANHNAPGQVVLAGRLGNLRSARTRAREVGLRAITLDVSGAFHSSAMAPAVVPFRQALAEIEIARPAIPVISAATGRPFADVREELAQAIIRPVRWRSTMLTLAELGARRFVDFGPGEVLAKLVARNLPDAGCIDRTDFFVASEREPAGVA